MTGGERRWSGTERDGGQVGGGKRSCEREDDEEEEAEGGERDQKRKCCVIVTSLRDMGAGRWRRSCIILSSIQSLLKFTVACTA